MKNVITLLILLIASLMVAQPCSNLIISEILFEGRIQSVTGGNEENLNFVLELFNPTQKDIDLDAYEIILLNIENESSLKLDGIIESGETFVISSPNEESQYESNLISENLNFLTTDILSLVHNNKVIDQFGQLGLSETWESIDFSALLENPESVSFLNINTKSLEFLDIRRNKSIKEGNTEFESSDFLEEWFLYPAQDVTNIGQYFCSCTDPIAYWDKVDNFTSISQFRPEKELDETRGSQTRLFIDAAVEWVDATFRVENHTQDVTCLIWDGGNKHEYLPLDDEASEFDYGFSFPQTAIINEIDVPVGTNTIFLNEFSWAVQDFFPEGFEGYGFDLKCAHAGSIIDDPDRDIMDLRIVPGTSSTNEVFAKDVKIYPTVTNSILNIELKENEPAKIFIYNLMGRKLYVDNIKG